MMHSLMLRTGKQIECNLIDPDSAQIASIDLPNVKQQKTKIFRSFKKAVKLVSSIDFEKNLDSQKRFKKELIQTGEEGGLIFKRIRKNLDLNLNKNSYLNLIVDDKTSEIPWELAILKKGTNSICKSINLSRMRVVKNQYNRWYNIDQLRRKPKALIIGINYENDDDLNLSSPEKEADNISHLLENAGFSVTTLIGNEASRKAIVKGLKKEVDVFHFSGHGDLSKKNDNSLIVSDGTMINSSDIGHLLGNAVSPKIVYLNACLTSLERVNITDGKWDPYTWASAFLEKGSSVFIGSLWPISDYPSSKFAERFYNELLNKDNSTLGRVFRNARIKTMKINDPYNTWLSMLLYGSSFVPLEKIIPTYPYG